MPRVKKDLDSVQSPALKRVSYENLAIRNSKKVPEEYRTLKKAKRRGGGCLFFLFILFLAAAAGFYYFSFQQKPQVKNSLEMSVEYPRDIASGDQATYVVKYKNLDTVALQKMELSVKWPNGFYYDESSQKPRDDSATIWDLPDLPVGQEATLEIKGQLVGNQDEVLKASFVMQYQPANFNSDFNNKIEKETKITESKLSLAVDGSDKTMVSTSQEYQIKFKNLTNEDQVDLLLDILYPDDFTLVSVDPKKDGDYWPANLKAEEEKTIIIKGSFDPDSKADQLLVVEIGRQVNDKFRRLARVEKNITVVNPSFSVKFQVNNKLENQTVNWGDKLDYQLEITNNSDSDLKDVEISALLDGAVLDWDKLNINNGGQRNNSTIVWNKDTNIDLANWPKGETRNFSWDIMVVDKPIAERMLDNVIKINIQGLADWEQVQPAITLTVGENIKFNAGIYWDLAGRRVGSGVIPPKVGAETQYLVVWSLVSTTGNFNSINVDSDLPPGVEFVSETDIQEGELSFDQDTRTLSWNISDMKDVILPVTASFIIKIEPKLADQGQAMTLLNPITVTAKGLEEVKVRSKMLNTSDVVANTTESVGIVQ